MDIDTMRRRVRERVPHNRRWWDVRNATGDQAVLRIYDEVWWLGVNADDFARDLDGITAPEIEVQINSPGGDVWDGIAIYNALRSHSARVITRVDGMAASIASVIAQAGDQRIMLSGSQMMIHEAWGLAVGSAADMREYAGFLDKQSDVIASIYAERASGDTAHFRALMDAETWFAAEEAVDSGLADEVVSPPRREPANKAKTLQDEIADAMAVVSAAITSAERVDALRAEKGKSLSQVNVDSLDELRGHIGRLDALLKQDTTDHSDELRREFAKFVSITQGVEL